MRSKKRIAFEVIEKAAAREPETVNAALSHDKDYIPFGVKNTIRTLE